MANKLLSKRVSTVEHWNAISASLKAFGNSARGPEAEAVSSARMIEYYKTEKGQQQRATVSARIIEYYKIEKGQEH